MHVRGYKEEGTTSTPFDMVMMNDLDRFHLVIDVIDRVPAWARGPRCCASRWSTPGGSARARPANTATTSPRSGTGPGAAATVPRRTARLPARRTARALLESETVGRRRHEPVRRRPEMTSTSISTTSGRVPPGQVSGPSSAGCRSMSARVARPRARTLQPAWCSLVHVVDLEPDASVLDLQSQRGVRRGSGTGSCSGRSPGS